MKSFSFKESPIKVFGAPLFEKTGTLHRFPAELSKYFSLISKNPCDLRRRCAGARVCFRTDSPKFTVTVKIEKLELDIGMSLFSGDAVAVITGDRQNFKYRGLVSPRNYEQTEYTGVFSKENLMEDVMLCLPRNSYIKDIEISIEDSAHIEPPTPYKVEKPVVFYGSSITEGAHSSLPFTSYTALLSNRLDFDYYNLGFSGSAMGEKEMAEYIATFDMSAFIFDYDHNAPNMEHLKNTHEPFFKIIREAHPDLPIIMMSKPKAQYEKGDLLRKEVIKTTYENALKGGDKNVYFVDGETFFGETEREICSTDATHPNDIGFIRMANVLEPVFKKVLKI